MALSGCFSWVLVRALILSHRDLAFSEHSQIIFLMILFFCAFVDYTKHIDDKREKGVS